MPMYFDIALPITTAGGANTLSSGPHVRLLTGSNVNAGVKGCYVGSRFGTAGGGQIRVVTPSSASSSGTTYTPTPRNPSFSAAVTCAASSSATIQGGTTPVRFSIGFAQTGGMGGWVAIEPDAAIWLRPGGGSNGNCDFNSIANSASVSADLTIEFSEQ